MKLATVFALLMGAFALFAETSVSAPNVESVRREKLRSAMFNWLFAQPTGPGGPPKFGL